MKNFIQNGDAYSFIVPKNVSSGDLVRVGALFGVASCDAVAGEYISLFFQGVFMFKTQTNFAPGDLVSWDDTNQLCVAPGAGKFPIGACVNPTERGVVFVRLNGTTTTAA